MRGLSDVVALRLERGGGFVLVLADGSVYVEPTGIGACRATSSIDSSTYLAASHQLHLHTRQGDDALSVRVM